MTKVIELIRTAKIGRERKEAQVDTCAAFAAALYDTLTDIGLDVRLMTVGRRGYAVESTWYHSVVEHDGKYYDSLGEFSQDIIRDRLKIHPEVEYDLSFTPERREGCYDEEDYGMLYEFLVSEFRKAAKKIKLTPGVQP